MLIQGGKSNDGNVTGLDLSTVRASNGTHLYAFDENNNKTNYLVESIVRGGGIALGSGNFANPTPAFGQAPDHNATTNRNAVGAHDDIYTRNFKTVADLRAQTDASGAVINLASLSGNKVFWRGYYAESDGGGNWGIVKTGNSTSLVDDGGSIFVIVNDAVNGVWVEANLVGDIYVEQFGGVPDGATDRTVSWENCRNYCLLDVTNRVFKARQGQHKLTNGINLYGLLNIDVAGNISTNLETDEIVIGSNVVQGNPSKYLFKNGNCTLKVFGMSRGHVEFLRFERLWLYSENETGVTTTKYNVSYSNFYFTEIDQLRMETKTISGTTAWMNENSFFGGRIRESLTMTGDYPMNSNKFYGVKMESITVTIDSSNGNLGAHSNTWHDTRFEGSMTFNFGAGTFNNVFYQAWANFSFVGFIGRNAGSWTVNDLGNNNDIITLQNTYTDAESLFELSAESSNYWWEHFERQGHQLKNRKTFTYFFDTGLVPLDNPIWFVAESDSPSFNYFVEIYDESGNRIYTNQNVVEAGMSWNNTFGYYDNGGVSSAGQEISIKKVSGVGFFRLRVRTGSGTLNNLITYWRLRSIQKKKGRREIALLPYLGRQTSFFGSSQPTYGTFKRGDIIENSAPAIGQPSYWKCVSSGTFSSASATGGTTTGNIGTNRAQISNLSSTADFRVGDYISASAGFAAGDIKVISIDSSTSLTVDVTSTSVQSGVTIQTVNPLFGAGPSLT